MNPFLETYTPDWSGARGETVLNRVRFAEALAPLLGGNVAKPDNDSDSRNPSHWTAEIVVDGLRLYVGRSRDLERVEISAGAPNEVRRVIGYTRTVYPRMTCDTGRPLDALAKEIRRKVILPAAEPLAADMEELRRATAAEQGIKAQRAALLKRFPFPEITSQGQREIIRIGEPDAKGGDVSLYAAGAGFSLSARLKPDGSLYVDRLSYGGNAADLLAWLYGKGA
jgi:hypothetical protein